MADSYRIHLNFLPIAGEIPAFRVYRQIRPDAAGARPEDRGIHGYSLPRSSANLEDRASYWVSLDARDGFEEFMAQPGFNNDLTRWVIFDALCANVRAQLKPEDFWIPDHGFLPEAHLCMVRHTEGVEQLIVQPYLLKSAAKFGFLVDFHFRLAEGVPFSRRIQQLSLSLDRNFKRNLDYYVERISKITDFVKERWAVLSELKLPGQGQPVRLSREFEPLPADRLRSRVYVFGGNKESRNQFTGLRDFGPLKCVESSPRLLFIFREQDRPAARTLAVALRGAKQRERFSFPGFESLFRSPLEIDSNPVVIPDFSREAMEVALARVKRESGLVMPVLVIPEDDDAAYLAHKAVFTHSGVSTQVCTLGVIQDESALKWATANIALQVFCKAGGQPWKVRPTATSERSLIIGISQSHKTRIESDKVKVDKHFAFSVMTDSSGLFQKIKVLGESERETDYLAQLRENLRQLLVANAKEFTRVVIHTSFKLKRQEIDAIQRVTQEAAASPDSGTTRFAVVKVNHRSRFFGGNRGVNSLVPYEATQVKLGAGEFLVWFEGILPEKLTVTKAFPGPTHLQILRVSDTKRVSEEALLQELVNLSGANWRGFNAKSAPVSVFYCHLVADVVHDFHERGLPLPGVEDLKPWFL